MSRQPRRYLNVAQVEQRLGLGRGALSRAKFPTPDVVVGPVNDDGISNVENGNKKASDRLLTAWAKALGIEPLNVWHGPLRPPVEPAKPPKRVKTSDSSRERVA